MRFFDFRRSKCIFTQPIAEKSMSLADFQKYDRICTQPIAKRKEKKVMYLKKNPCLGGGGRKG